MDSENSDYQGMAGRIGVPASDNEIRLLVTPFSDKGLTTSAEYKLLVDEIEVATFTTDKASKQELKFSHEDSGK